MTGTGQRNGIKSSGGANLSGHAAVQELGINRKWTHPSRPVVNEPFSKSRWKLIVKESMRKVAFDFLIKEAGQKTKMRKLKYSDLELQNYLKTTELSNSEKKYIFQLRSSMTKVGYNYGNKRKCPLCNVENDDIQHLTACVVVRIFNPVIRENCDNFSLDDIYKDDILKQRNTAAIVRQAMRTREKILG